METRAWLSIFSTLVFLSGVVDCVEVHFEQKDGGFFLRHSRGEDITPYSTTTSTDDRGEIATLNDQGALLSVDRFTVLQTAQPVAVRATYGPFSTKQTVPARYIVPDPLDPLPTESTSSHGLVNATLPLSAVLDVDLYSHNLDISAHVVTPEVQRDSPVLRVLFHTGQSLGVFRSSDAPTSPVVDRPRVCIVLHATLDDRIGGTSGVVGATNLAAACSPEGRDGICLAEIPLPISWWPSALQPEGSKKPLKPPKSVVQVAYSVFEPWDGEQCVSTPAARVQIQPVTPLATVPLTPAKHGYRELHSDDMVHLLVPQGPLYPNSRVYIPVYLVDQEQFPISFFVMRARVKNGLKIMDVEVTSEHWNVSVEFNQKHTSVTVTAFKKERSDPIANRAVVEVFSWFLAVEDPTDFWEGGKIVWMLRYVLESTALQAATRGRVPWKLDDLEEERRKLTTRLDIQKDDVQAVLPISKNWELINTAVLTGRQVSQPMKVFIVSQAGLVADVTLKSSCHSEDESVLKVSSSCTSVYVDGSEIRGSSNASVMVKYGTYTGNAKFTVWMPEFPLEMDVADPKLSQIRGWKVPQGLKQKVKRFAEDNSHFRKRGMSGHRWQNQPNSAADHLDGDNDRYACRPRFQQSRIEVYARFVAEDQDSGRISYFLSRKAYLRMTDLIQSLLRVADSRIASLKGCIIQGLSTGRTEVQVISPITGRVIGAKEVRVAINDKVSLDKMTVNVISGLQLSILPDGDIENGYVAETSVTRKLTAKYQEGLLDIELQFSDGSSTPLREIAVDDYYLGVESLNSSIVAFAPMMASHHPRVIAVGQGEGDLLSVVLELADDCHRKNSQPLVTAHAHVEVDFTANRRPEFVQNDGSPHRDSRAKWNRGKDRKKQDEDGNLNDILIGFGEPMRDENNDEPTMEAHQYPIGKHGPMTPLEIGMYVLLGVFCIAIFIFVISCVVYASKFKKKEALKGHDKNDSTTNAHDWVWLGRATLERASTHQVNQPRDQNGNAAAVKKKERKPVVVNVTTNPSYDENAATEPVVPVINSQTYNKKTGSSPPPPDPPPPIPTDSNDLSFEKEYKPPVPPHRNVGVTAKISPTKVHSRRNSSKHAGPRAASPRVDLSGVDQPPPYGGIRVLPNPSACKSRKQRGGSGGSSGSGDQHARDNLLSEPVFVEFPDDGGTFLKKNSPEVKRATIVGNPMFSAVAGVEDEANASTPSEVGLDLNLGMDYDQLVEYFDNLKESNA